MSVGSYASGKFAFGFCDRCGFRYSLNDLKMEIEEGEPNGLRVCPECLDQDHPQNWQGRFETADAQALMNPRPDTSLDDSRRLFSWNPVGGPTQEVKVKIGRVTVTTS